MKNIGLIQKYLKRVLVVLVFILIFYLGYTDIVTNINDNSIDAALKYYQDKSGSETDMEGIRAASIRLGCHEEIRIYKNNEILMRVNYVNGRIYE